MYFHDVCEYLFYFLVFFSVLLSFSPDPGHNTYFFVTPQVRNFTRIESHSVRLKIIYLMTFNLIINTMHAHKISCSILVYFILSIITPMYNLDLFIDIHHVVVLLGLRTAIFIPHCLYSFDEVCGWSSSVFAPAPLVRLTVARCFVRAVIGGACGLRCRRVLFRALVLRRFAYAENHLFACSKKQL